MLGELSESLDELNAEMSSRGPWWLLSALGVNYPQPQKNRIPCPIHGGDGYNCSFSVKDGVILFYCFSGGCSGNAFDLIAHFSGIDINTKFGLVVKKCKELLGRSVKFNTYEPENAIKRSSCFENILDDIMKACPLEGSIPKNYLKSRGIIPFLAQMRGVGYCSDPTGLLNLLVSKYGNDTLFDNKIICRHGFVLRNHPLLFSYKENGTTLAIQGRSIDLNCDKRFRWKTIGSLSVPFNIDEIKSIGIDDKLILTEGPIDTLSAEMLFTSWNTVAIGIPGVRSIKKNWFNKYFRGKNIVVMFDEDQAGFDGSKILIKELIKYGCRVFDLNLSLDGDLNDYLQKTLKINGISL